MLGGKDVGIQGDGEGGLELDVLVGSSGESLVIKYEEELPELME
ncbi:unnamed protein product, partial [Brassica oleracea]